LSLCLRLGNFRLCSLKRLFQKSYEKKTKSQEITPNNALKNARLAKGWTQRRLAKKVAIDEQIGSSWERRMHVSAVEVRTTFNMLLEKTPEELDLEPHTEKQE
jgi:ribosome-binding protein aMBF1 (putative translation factor)